MSTLATSLKKQKMIGSRTTRTKPGDETAARELVLFTENEARLWGPGNTQGASIRKNLELKAQKGTLDASKAPKLFEYLMASAAKLYGQEYGGTFDAPTRRLAAKDMAESYLEELGYQGGLGKVTEVMFRVHGPELVAVFPYVVETMGGNVMAYSSMDGFVNGEVKAMIRSSSPAPASSYAGMKKQLESGPSPMKLKVITKYSHPKYLKAFQELREKKS